MQGFPELRHTSYMRIITLLAFALLPAFAQEAKIMIVEKSDSQKLAKAYREFKEAQKAWEEAKTAVSKSYTTEKGKTLEGWEKVQFSADFRAMVPYSSPYASSGWCNGGLILNSGSAYTNSIPAVATIGGIGTVTSTMSPSEFIVNSDIKSDLTTKERGSSR